MYDKALRKLQRREYTEAAAVLGEVASHNGPKAEGASYWQAYALHRAGQRPEALAALETFAKKYPGSRWLNDAKALELEIRQAQGQKVSPDGQADEELKLMALAGLMAGDASRVLPTLRKVLEGGSSVRVKEQALFVIAQSNNPEAYQIIADYAKGRGNPDLQMTAINLLSTHRSPETVNLIGDLYRGTTDPGMRRRILQALVQLGAGEKILDFAKAETDPRLKAEAVRMLGTVNTTVFPPEAVRTMYAGESNKEVKQALLDVIGMRKDSKTLTELFRAEKDPRLREHLLHRLQDADPRAAQDLMISILEK